MPASPIAHVSVSSVTILLAYTTLTATYRQKDVLGGFRLAINGKGSVRQVAAQSL